MSNQVFPVLPGLKWEVIKKPSFSNLIQTAASGKESRAMLWLYPRWEFTLSYEILRAATAYQEIQSLMGFFLSRHGSFDTFLYTDPSDYSVTNQAIGTGDGATRTFQLARTYGGFTEPAYCPNGTPTVKLNGVTQPTGWTGGTLATNGLITFATAPGNGVAVTADFSYYYRCRFLNPESEFSNFMYQLWEAKEVNLISVKGEYA